MSASESRSAVVLELAEEFMERYRQGQRPSLKEYIDRHPELAADIKEVFPAMAMMENIALADESLDGDDEASRGRQPPEALYEFENAAPVPVTFKAGRNTLLCKVRPNAGTHYFYLRIGDNPLDRAILLAKLGLWDEAAALFARGIDRQAPAEQLLYTRCAHAQLLVGDTAGYRRYVARMFERFDRDTPPYEWLLYAGGLLDGAVEAKRLMELAERAPERDNNNPFILHAAGIAYYRAGQFDKAIGRLEESLKNTAWLQGGGHASELGLALAHHRLGYTKEAQQWLDKAEQWYEKAIQKALAIPYGQATLYNWADWPSFVVLRREAHKQILGTDLPDDPRIKKLADGMRDWLKQRDPAIADYDVAVFWYGRQPYPWLYRARRFIELKRNKEAEADLARIDRFTTNDAEVWKERGRLYFELGHVDKAEADFAKARTLLETKKAEPKK